MPLVVKDRVQETTATTGTGTLTLDGAVQGFQTFSSAIGNTNTTYYAIFGSSEWEVGLGTVGAGTLSRDTVLESSNSGNKVDFSAGSKRVICTYPAEKSIYLDENNALTVTNNANFAGVTCSGNALLQANLNVNGNATFGDASGDTVTFNAATVSTPNGLNFDSDTFVIDASNNRVGIGLTNPSTKLQVQTAAQGTDGITVGGPSSKALTILPNLSVSAFNSIVQAGDNGIIYGTGSVGTGTFVIAPWVSSGTSGIRMDSSGNVGIGTSSPAQKLDVNGSISCGSAIFTGTGVSTGDSAIEIGALRTGSGNAYIDFHAVASTDFDFRILRLGGANGAAQVVNTGTGDLQITQTNAGAITLNISNAEKVRIASNGDVSFKNGINENVYAIVDGASVDLDPTNGTIQTWTLGASRSPTANGFAAGDSMTLMVNDGTAYTITWPSVTWAGGNAPVLATTGFTVIELWKVGTTLYGALVGTVA